MSKSPLLLLLFLLLGDLLRQHVPVDQRLFHTHGPLTDSLVLIGLARKKWGEIPKRKTNFVKLLPAVRLVDDEWREEQGTLIYYVTSFTDRLSTAEERENIV